MHYVWNDMHYVNYIMCIMCGLCLATFKTANFTYSSENAVKVYDVLSVVSLCSTIWRGGVINLYLHATFLLQPLSIVFSIWTAITFHESEKIKNYLFEWPKRNIPSMETFRSYKEGWEIWNHPYHLGHGCSHLLFSLQEKMKLGHSLRDLVDYWKISFIWARVVCFAQKLFKEKEVTGVS